MSEDFPPAQLSTDELFRQYAPFVARMLYRLGVAPSEVDDALQQVFVVVHRNGGYVRGPATPTSYLGNIAAKAAASMRRRQHSQRVRATATAPEELATPARDPVQLLEVDQELQQLHAVLSKLDPELRALLLLVELEGETCTSIAASQGVPVGTVYWRVHRARQKFRSLVRQMNQGSRSHTRPEGRSHEPHP